MFQIPNTTREFHILLPTRKWVGGILKQDSYEDHQKYAARQQENLAHKDDPCLMGSHDECEEIYWHLSSLR